MKKLLLLCLTALMGLAAEAQTAGCDDTVTVFPYEADFVDLSCWTPDSSSTWTAALYQSLQPVARVTVRSTIISDQWLVSPPLQLPDDTVGLQMRWDACKSSGAQINYLVLVSTDDGTTWDTITTWNYYANQTSLQNAWPVDLSPYAGQTVRVAFCVPPASGGHSLIIANLSIRSDRMPWGDWWGQDFVVATGDTVCYEYDLQSAAGTVCSFQWQSPMVAAGLATAVDTVVGTYTLNGTVYPRSIYRVVYHAQGNDTVTLTVSNPYGTLMRQNRARAYVCAPIDTFPAIINHDILTVCGRMENFYLYSAGTVWNFTDEDGGNNTFEGYLQSGSGVYGYILTPPIVVPASEEHLALILRYRYGTIEVRGVAADVTDTSLYTDLLFYEEQGGIQLMKTRKVNLAAYVGDTVRLAIINRAGTTVQMAPYLEVDYDTLPKLHALTVPGRLYTDSAVVCTASMRYGATDGLHHTWHSVLGSTIVTNALGDTAWITAAGAMGPTDTISVVATNSYGSDTMSTTAAIVDCEPATALPWVETFYFGDRCWYKPAGSNWHDAKPYSYYSGYYNDSHRALVSSYSENDEWIVSKAIEVPADTLLNVVLEWDVAAEMGSVEHQPHYSVLVSTAADRTDLTAYTALLTDTSGVVVAGGNWSNRDRRSVSLAPYAGQTIHVAFRSLPAYYDIASEKLVIDNVTVRSTAAPVVALTAPATVDSHEPVTFGIAITEGSDSNLTITWHSTLIDTALVVTEPTVTVTYTADGVDTVTVVAVNAYGSDTATAVVTVNGCAPIATLPWMENFNNIIGTPYNDANGVVPTCWHRYWNGGSADYTPHVIDSYPYNPINGHVSLGDKALMMIAGTSTDDYDSVAVVESPAFDLPLNGHLLSFYYMHESANYGTLSVGYMQDGAFVGVANMEPQAAGRTDTVMLNALPDDVHRFALQWKKTGTWYGVIVDDVSVSEADSMPAVRIEVLTQTPFVDAPVTFRAVLTNGLPDGLTYTWHSSLTGSTWSGTNEWSVTYNVGGDDTISVIVANAYGADTAWTVVYLDSPPLPLATLTAPASAYMGDTVTLNASINGCSTNGLAYSWHSSMLDTTIASSLAITLAYTASGTDTVTFIVSNAYGADTAVAYIYVVDCGGATVPYVETFEGVTPIVWSTAGQSSLPLCWQVAYDGSDTNIHQPTVVSSYNYISDMPDNALLMMAGTTNGYATWVQAELPAFNKPLPSLAMALDYRYESASQGRLVAGYYDDSTGTFYDVDTLAPHAGSYLRDTVYFDAAAAPTGSRIALRWSLTGIWYAVAIDNIEVFSDNGIQAPSTLTAENVTGTCATLRWSEVDTATAYQVALDGAMNIDTVVTDTTLTLCGLVDDADYNVHVMTLVGSDEGLSIATTFRTLMLCAPLADVSISPEGIISWQYDTLVAEQTPVGVEIEVIDQQGQTLVLTDTAYNSPYVPTNLSPGHTYSFAVRTLCASTTATTADTVVLQVAPSVCAEAASTGVIMGSRFMDNYWDANYSQVLYPASFATGIDTLYGIALRVAQFNAHGYTSQQTYRFDIYVGQLADSSLAAPLTADSLTAVALNKSFTVSEAGWVDILFDSLFLCDDSKNLIVTMVQRSSNPYATIYYGVHTDASSTHFVQDASHVDGYTNPSTLNFQWETNAYIPDIRLLGGCGGSVNTCLAPEVEVTAVDTHSVTLQWTQRGSESLWQVEYCPANTNAWQVADTTSATGFTITGLAQASHYQIRVSAVCSDSLIVYGFPHSATTLCGYAELPYTISFLADEYPCWSLGSSLYHNNWNGITLSEWNTDGYLISPELNTPVANLRATITSLRPVAESYESHFAVGVGDADGSNVTWVDTIGFLQQNTVQTDEVYFNHYTGSGHYIILKGVEGTCDIRQFSLEAFAGCVPVHELTVGGIDENSAQLSWAPEVATNTWAVYLDGSLVATTATPSYTLTGLTSNTQYTVAVREICGAGDTSTAVTRMFQTQCDAFALPYFEEFDQAPLIGSEHILTDCWAFHKAGNYASAYCIGDQWSYTCLTFNDSHEGYDVINYLSSPRLTVGSGGAVVSFKGQTTYLGTFTVGIMLSPYDTSSFIPVRDITVSSGGMAWYSFSTDTIAGAPTSGTFTVAFRFNGENGNGVIDSLTVTANPPVTYELTLVVNDTTMGTVSGAGTYETGTDVNVTATPNEGFRFVVWDDGDTNAIRSVKVEHDISLTAYFEALPPEQYTVTITAVMRDGSQQDGLDEMVHGAGTYMDGDTVTLEGEEHGCSTSFVFWVTAEGDTLCDNPYTFIVHSDVTLTAVFAIFGGIGDVESLRWTLYPNPASMTVTVESSEPAEIGLFDVSGREVKRTALGVGTTTVDLGGLPQGVYFVRLGGAVKKLIVR